MHLLPVLSSATHPRMWANPENEQSLVYPEFGACGVAGVDWWDSWCDSSHSYAVTQWMGRSAM